MNNRRTSSVTHSMTMTTMANSPLSNILKGHEDVEKATQPAVLLDSFDPLTKLERELIRLTRPLWEVLDGNMAAKRVALLEGVVGSAHISRNFATGNRFNFLLTRHLSGSKTPRRSWSSASRPLELKPLILNPKPNSFQLSLNSSNPTATLRLWTPSLATSAQNGNSSILARRPNGRG